MKKLNKLLPAVAAALAANQASAFVFFDPFDYPAGPLAEVVPASPNNEFTGRNNIFGSMWHATGVATSTDFVSVTAPTLNAPAWLGGSGNSAEWAGPGGGTAASARVELGPFSGFSAGGYDRTLYYSLALNVTDVAVLNPSTSGVGYIIAGFNTVAGPQTTNPGVIGARLLARQHPSDITKYQLGMSKNSSTAADVQWDPRIFNPGDTQFVVGSYTLLGTGADANDIAKLWINPDPNTTFGALEGSVPVEDITRNSGSDLTTNRIESFLLRQSGPAGSGASNTGIRVDELRVDTTWAGVAPGSPTDWTGGNSGNWSDTAKWSTAVAPNAAGKFVRLPLTTGPATVTMDAAHTVGTIHFFNPNGYTIAGANALTMSGSSSIVVYNGFNTIAAPLVSAGDLTVNCALGENLLTVNDFSMSPGGALRKFGGGEARFNHVRGNRLEVFAGLLRMLPDSGANGVSVVNTLDIPLFTDTPSVRPPGYVFDVGPIGTLDLQTNKLIVHSGTLGTWAGTTYTGIQGLIKHARDGGDGNWEGTGITTTAPDTGGADQTLGVGTGSQILSLAPTETAVWAGQTISGNSVVVMYTYAGDANLDGTINADDYANIDFNAPNPAATGYYNGDFNYDGNIDADDYAVIDFNRIAQDDPFYVSGGVESVAPVPEPAACGMVAAGAFLLARRRKRA